MGENTENKVKIRFKFRSGEEFEAEGSPSFIEKQRADFLHLIGKESVLRAAKTRILSQSSPTISENPFGHFLPAAPYQNIPPAAPNTPKEAPRTPAQETHADTISADTSAPSADTRINADKRLWENITRPEDNLFILRRKSRLLERNSAALLLIAAAKVLDNAQQGVSALTLSKALNKSGYGGGGRLDRILSAEMKLGAVKAVGSKRSRSYFLSDEGFARAYVLAGKLAEEWL